MLETRYLIFGDNQNFIACYEATTRNSNMHALKQLLPKLKVATDNKSQIFVLIYGT